MTGGEYNCAPCGAETSSLIPGRAGRDTRPRSGADRRSKARTRVRGDNAAGEIDIATAPQLEEPLSDLAGAGHRLVANLSRVSFIDAAGLRVLARAAGPARRREPACTSSATVPRSSGCSSSPAWTGGRDPPHAGRGAPGRD